MNRRSGVTLSNGIRFEGLDELDLRVIVFLTDPENHGWIRQSDVVVGPIAADGRSIEPSESTLRRRIDALCSPAKGRRAVHPAGHVINLSHQMLGRQAIFRGYEIIANTSAEEVGRILRGAGWGDVPTAVLIRGDVRPRELEW